jgi:hypothetical protein
MLYLKNTLGGLSRSLTDSALHSFRGPHRWWKLALFAGLLVLPGGSVGVALLAWVEHRRGAKEGKGGNAGVAETGGVQFSAETIGLAASKLATTPVTTPTAAASPVVACLARGDAPCRAAAGKQARQNSSAESRV